MKNDGPMSPSDLVPDSSIDWLRINRQLAECVDTRAIFLYDMSSRRLSEEIANTVTDDLESAGWVVVCDRVFMDKSIVYVKRPDASGN